MASVVDEKKVNFLRDCLFGKEKDVKNASMLTCDPLIFPFDWLEVGWNQFKEISKGLKKQCWLYQSDEVCTVALSAWQKVICNKTINENEFSTLIRQMKFFCHWNESLNMYWMRHITSIYKITFFSGMPENDNILNITWENDFISLISFQQTPCNFEWMRIQKWSVY